VALFTAHAQEAVLQAATGQVGVELLLEEIGQRNALLRKMRAKLGEILLHDLVEQRAFRAVARIDRRPGHNAGIRAGRWQQHDRVPAMRCMLAGYGTLGSPGTSDLPLRSM